MPTPDPAAASARSVDYSRKLRFRDGCVVDVAVRDFGAGRRVTINAGATLTAEEAIQLAHAIVEARATMVAVEEAERDADA